ncbi:MAG TPA: efflux RND transporter periplasmic adaptor subunit [Blastocatellia bacterium]|jgi:multidrug efflux system membrane fusion protein|nr:efflux RND transporter periplasmic adaptor subunit [Blastocatellia bacterium]
MKKHPKKSGALTLMVMTAILGAGCGKKQEMSLARPPAPVTVAAAAQRDVPVYLDEIGKCAAREVVEIRPQVSGRITNIHFADGADLKKGAMLFTIDPRPFEASLQQAEANLARDIALKKQAEAALARDKAQAKLGEAQARRYSQLNRQGVVSNEQYDQTQTSAEALNATVAADEATVRNVEEAIKADQAAIENAKLQLSYCFIRSPIDGRAGQRLADVGNLAALGAGTPLLVIQRLDPIYADFTISQNDLSAVQRNMSQGTLKAEVRLPDEANKPVVGNLTFVDNEVKGATGTVNLRATIANGDRRFWPGRFVNVRLVLNVLHGAILIPATAPQMSARGQFVYVIKGDSTAEMRPVTVGQRQGDMVVIQKGISSGEKVVVNGHMGVTPGGKVLVEPPKVTDLSENGGKL